MIAKNVAAAFLPNRVVSRQVLGTILAAQVGLALLLWWTAPAAVLPKPLEVLSALGELWAERGLGRELFGSLLTSLEALALTAAISLPLSYAAVVPALRPLAFAASKGRFLGLVGLTFAFTLAVGGGHSLKLALLVFGMSVFLITSLAAEVAGIAQSRFDHARTLRMSEGRVVWEVVVLGTADRALELLRQNAAIGWTLLTMVEGLVRSEGGVGAMLLNQNKHFHLPEVFAIQVAILGVGVLQDYALGALRRLVCPYAELRR